MQLKIREGNKRIECIKGNVEAVPLRRNGQLIEME